MHMWKPELNFRRKIRTSTFTRRKCSQTWTDGSPLLSLSTSEIQSPSRECLLLNLHAKAESRSFARSSAPWQGWKSVSYPNIGHQVRRISISHRTTDSKDNKFKKFQRENIIRQRILQIQGSTSLKDDEFLRLKGQEFHKQTTESTWIRNIGSEISDPRLGSNLNLDPKTRRMPSLVSKM